MRKKHVIMEMRTRARELYQVPRGNILCDMEFTERYANHDLNTTLGVMKEMLKEFPEKRFIIVEEWELESKGYGKGKCDTCGSEFEITTTGTVEDTWCINQGCEGKIILDGKK